MRVSIMVVVVAAAALTVSSDAQTTLDWPVGLFRPYEQDSGMLQNASESAEVVYVHTVVVRGAAWLRVYFADVELGRGSFVRLTSLLDNEVQVLDASGVAMWHDSSAYFNGDAVVVELIAGPKTQRNRLVIDKIAFQIGETLPEGSCGICGPDDRQPSGEDWAGRLLPAGCTASVWNVESCVVSAGHCISGGDTMQFRVPESNPDCSLNHPPIAEQFPITQSIFVNGGVGNDWAAMTAGTNNLGQTPFERYGEFRPIAIVPPSTNDPLAVWGYGVDSECTFSQTQQTDFGSVVSVFTQHFLYNVDATFGNSGSSVVRQGEILGIATHCPCPNVATRFDHPAFVAARDSLCAAAATPGDENGDGDLDLFDFAGFLACVTGPGAGGLPPECEVFDFDEDDHVDLVDFRVLQFEFTGNCGVTITQQPQDASVCANGAAVLSMEADGEDLAYQWFHNGAIPGATEPTLLIDPVTESDLGTYTVVATSECAVRISDAVVIALSDPPTISDHPPNVFVCLGDPAEFSVGASGVEPLLFQWQYEGKDIPGATENTYAIDEVGIDHLGSYVCVVTDDCDLSSVSDEGLLIEHLQAVITGQPEGGEYCVGKNVFVFVSAIGAHTYQWYKDGQALPGETEFFLGILDATIEDSGAYDVDVIGYCNFVTSDEAQIDVIDCR